MTLEDFKRSADIIWDTANKAITQVATANSGDVNGRKMRVQVKNGATVEDLTGYTLNLGWKSVSDPTKKGLDAFDVVDITKGIFEITYTTAMLSNIGRLVSVLQLIGLDDDIESSKFIILVTASAIDADAIQTESSFTALTEALVTVNMLSEGFQAAIDGYEADHAQSVADHDAVVDNTATLADHTSRLAVVESGKVDRLSIESPPIIPHAKDDEFTDGALDVKWAWVNQGGTTVSEGNGALFVHMNTPDEDVMLLQTAPVGNFTVMAKIAFYGETLDYHEFGLVFRNGADGNHALFSRALRGGAFSGFKVTKRSISSWVDDSMTANYTNPNICYFKVVKDAVNVTFFVSDDGIFWIQLYTEAISTYLVAVTQIGLASSRTSADVTKQYIGKCEWFRVTEP